LKVQGNTKDYLAARLKRDHPEIVDEVNKGRYKSIREAAIAKDIVKPRQFWMPTDPKKVVEKNCNISQIEIYCLRSCLAVFYLPYDKEVTCTLFPRNRFRSSGRFMQMLRLL
jgi:hypothetical protein